MTTVTAGLGLPDSSEQCPLTFFLQDFYRPFRQSGSGRFEVIKSGIEVHEIEFQAKGRRQRFQNTSASLEGLVSQQIFVDCRCPSFSLAIG
jgi:hypothetical protein